MSKAQGTEQGRAGRALPPVVAACALLLTGVLAAVPAAQAADPRESVPRTAEIRQLEEQMEELETQLDAIYDTLDVYTVNSAPPGILAERQRIEQQLQQLHQQRSEALRTLTRPSAGSRRDLDPAKPTREPVRRKALANSLVKIGSNLVVRGDEIVNGDAIILGGNLRLEGEVLGDVVVLGGDLEIARSSRIGGQALVIGGRLDRGLGAVVEKEPLWLSFFPDRAGPDAGWSPGVTLLLDVTIFVLLLVIAGWLLLVHRRRCQRTLAYLETNRLRSFGFGVLLITAGTFAVSVMAMLLLATFFGIPLAILVGLMMAALLLSALCIGSHHLGQRILATLRLPRGPGLLAMSTGFVFILGPELLGDVLSSRNPWIDVLLDTTTALLSLLAFSLGLGAMVMTRLGRPGASSRAAAAAADGESSAEPVAVPG